MITVANDLPLLDVPVAPSGCRNEALAYVDAYDAVLNTDYAFLAYKEIDSSGEWRVRVQSSRTAGAVFEPAMIKNQARSAGAQGKAHFQWGYSFDPSAADPRRIQFLVHVQYGKPSAIEMIVQLRKFDGTADEVRSVRFPWPTA